MTERVSSDSLSSANLSLAVILDLMAELVCVTDAVGRFTYINPAWERAMGYTLAELAMLHPMDTIAPEDRGRYRAATNRVLAGETVTDFEVVLLTKQGTRLVCRGKAQPRLAEGPDGSAAYAGALAIYGDVTAERRAEATRARLATTLDVSPDLVSMMTADGQVVYLNRAGRRMLGLAEDVDLRTLSPAAVYPPDVWQRMLTEMVPTVVREGIWQGEATLATTKGEHIPVFQVLVAHPSFRPDEPPYFISTVMRDLRERIHAEATLRASETRFRGVLKTARAGQQAAARAAELEEQVRYRTTELRIALSAAEEANRAKDAFLARMSHELRTPLNSIIGFANVLIKNKAENLRPQELAYAERIGANGKHLLSLINSILDLAKIESGHMEAEITEVALGALVSEVVAQLEGIIRGRPVDFRVDMPSHIALVATDEAKMRQILMNLIGNALKFTETGSITVRIVTSPADARPQRIDVIDTGVGIPSDRIEAVFHPFEQVDTSTTRKYGGTGLGLAITRSMCDLLGFQLTVSSTVGKGSTFSVLLPTPSVGVDTPLVVPTTEVAPERRITRELAQDGSSAGIAPLTTLSDTPAMLRDLEERVVLMIDDDPDARTVLSHYIEGTGCRVFVANSGDEGLRLAAAHRPDIITLDLMMPDMNGWEVLRRLKSDPALQQIPIVVVSIVAGDSYGSVFGAVDLLDKPCTREELLTTLRRNLQPIRNNPGS